MGNVQQFSRPADDLPHSYEAEQALLGAILCNNAVYGRVAGFLKPDHFADALHGRIYEACGKLIGGSMRADPVTLKNLFDQDGALSEIGGAQYLVQLAQAVITVINAEDYGVAVRDLYERRQIIGLAERAMIEARNYGPDNSAADVAVVMAGELAKLEAAGPRTPLIRRMDDVLDDVLTQAEASYKDGSKVRGIMTGLSRLDGVVNGLCPGDLMILAGRPAMGKTALMNSVARNIASPRPDGAPGKRVGIESIEMTAEQLALRSLAGDSGVNTIKVRAGSVTESDLGRLIDASNDLRGLPIAVVATTAPTTAEIAVRWGNYRRRYGLDILMVDYLQLCRAAGKFPSRYEEVTAVSAGLKAAAKQLGVPVIALAQLSREVEKRDSKRPALSDLRDSGAIEQDADQIAFIYRHEYYLEKEEPQKRAGEDPNKFSKRLADWTTELEACRGHAELIVAKNRHGVTGTAKVRFDAERQRFEDLDAHSSTEPPASDPNDQWWSGQS